VNGERSGPFTKAAPSRTRPVVEMVLYSPPVWRRAFVLMVLYSAPVWGRAFVWRVLYSPPRVGGVPLSGGFCIRRPCGGVPSC